ncbi:putative F-box/LRR-repeat protein 23 isoform X1 [Salvia hispanica]|uniref:putative F-box/LRR-repeat protein 23 isoform X1 n=1 Tax=Salvia hispanica TaxID=49212 RepID=UPI0020093A32|nr:putative F-box/LRR-repeat protein 23 isoform X1 [Salvia hispanica]XP_047955074.1 putative F-box/LRR-repeat protein 23 isoform X1 [Salvia hispanica]XP_047955075.1 putative F-box/LRR-repeat protein 23 isoform X1 [Salvia hispanica]XP_047955076.1 putative F-box/LRR-repeat protein 23 isoform X1 [Salvia hispanica]
MNTRRKIRAAAEFSGSGRNMNIGSKIPAVASSSPPWIELPLDVTANILQRLGAEEMLCSAQQVCATWWNVCKDPSLWRVIDFSGTKQIDRTAKYTAMCRRAVDRSRGQLTDFTIQYFGGDELMEYIADRSPNLKRLKLGTCFFISGPCAARIVAKLGQLEELHITIRPRFGVIEPGVMSADIRAIGNACPTLKSFSLNAFKFILIEDVDENDDRPFIESIHRNLYALAISKSMPNLQHLQVYGLLIGNKGLEIILNGCPRLESLDIRRCFDLDLEGDLGKRCRQQIKHLKLPHDSTSDVPWPSCRGGDPFTSPPFSTYNPDIYYYNEDMDDYIQRYGYADLHESFGLLV